MQGVLLAGGNGGRLRPLTSDTAKVMVEVGGQPMIDYALDCLHTVEVDEIIIVVGYLGEQIIDYLGENYKDIPITYINQDQQLGTAHALLEAKDAITDNFILMYPDNIYSSTFELEGLIEVFERNDTDATILITEADIETAKKSGVVYRDTSGDITRIVEKPDSPSSTWILCGTYVFSQCFIDYCKEITLSDQDEYELTDALSLLQELQENVTFTELEEWVININTPKDQSMAEKQLTEGR